MMAVFLVSGPRMQRLRLKGSGMLRTTGRYWPTMSSTGGWGVVMAEEIYPLVFRVGRWWLPWGQEADAESIASMFRSDCRVVFLGAEGGSFTFDVTEEGQPVVRLDYGAWVALEKVVLSGWRLEAYELVQDAIDEM